MPKIKLPRRKCRYCEKICDRPSKFYCNNSCQNQYQINQKLLQGKIKHRSVKKLLLKEQGIRCNICNLTEWNGRNIPLILDHINGKHEDNSLENLRLICANCDMQLPTYKIKNKGNGRSYRRERYAEGKTY